MTVVVHGSNAQVPLTVHGIPVNPRHFHQTDSMHNSPVRNTVNILFPFLFSGKVTLHFCLTSAVSFIFVRRWSGTGANGTSTS